MHIKSRFKTTSVTALCAAAILFAACDKDDKPVLNKLQFDKSAIEVTIGNEATLHVKNGTAPFTAVLAMPKGTKVAEANVKGRDVILKGLSAGNATLTITDSNNDRGVVSVMVNKPVGTLELDNTSITLDKGTTAVVNVKTGIGEFRASPTTTMLWK